MRNFVCLGFRLLKLGFYIYFIVFLSFGWTAPVLAQEASASVSLVLEEASKSADQIIQQVSQIPNLRLPFEGNYSVSLHFKENYPQELLEKIGIKSGEEEHNGIDFETPEETQIVAVDDGEVVLAGDGDYGVTVKIRHPWGESVYGHLKEAKVKIDQKVTKGEQIALSGSSGTSSGPHLHFGIKPKNPIFDKLFGFVDPAPYFGIKEGVQDLAEVSDDTEVLGIKTASESAAVKESNAEATNSASLALPKAEKIATDSGYLFNYKFNLEKGTTAHFYDKASKSPSFAIADENYDYKLRFFLNQDASESAQPQVTNNKVEFPVKVGGIPMTLRYTLSADTIKEDFIIDEKPSEEILNQDENLNISFALSSKGLSRERVKEGYEFKSKDGTIVWRIANATIEDSSGKKGSPEDAYLEIDDTKAVLGVKKEFLKNASYPVVIDPTWTQTDWSGGSGQTSWSDATKFDTSSNVNRATSGQISIANSEKLSNNTFSTYSSSTGFSSWATGAQPNTVSGLVAWYKADALGLSNNASVSTWTDSSSSGFTLNQVSTTKPTYKTNVINGNAVVRFTRASSTAIGITSTTLAGYFSGASPASTVITVQNAASLNSNQRIWSATKSTDAAPFHDFANSSAAGNPWAGDRRSDANAFKQVRGASATAGTSYITSFVFDGSNAIIYTGGTGSTSTDLSGTLTSLNQFDLGFIRNGSTGMSTGGNYFDGDIAEVVVFNDDLTSANRSKVENYLRDKYNISVTSGITTITQDSTTTFNGNSYSAKLVTSSSDTGEFTQSVNVGNTNTYTLDAYVYTDGSAVSTSDAELFYNGSTITTTSTSMGSGWYKLSGTLTGANASRIYGVQVKANKTVYIGQMNLYESSAYNSSASLTSSIFDTAQRSDWGTMTYTTSSLPSNTSVSVKVRSSDSSTMSGATDFASCSAITSGSSISTGGCATDTNRYVQYQVTLSNTDSVSTPVFTDVSVNYSLSVPVAPSSFSGSVNSTSSITWSWTDNSSDEGGFYVQDTSGNTKCTVSSASTTTCTETGLAPGTSYTRKVVAYNSGGNSSASSNASATTRDLPVPSLISPADSSYINTERPVFKFQTPTDNSSTKKYSDVSTYKLLIGNADSTYITISNIPASRTTDYDGGTYVASYEGFSDSDITNNYITIYTKTSTSWSSTSNDGKLKSGKNTWYVTSVDSAGNENAVSRIIYADYAKPAIVSLSSSDKLGEKDGYLILTERTPTMTAEITDNLALDRVELVFSKENYLLGALISTDELFTQGYSLISADDNTDFLLRVISSRTLDLGSYSLTLKAYDEAGNQSLVSTLKMKILTSEEAQQLLQGKVAEESQTTISLTDLEKKALLRREKEAAELQKFFEEIRTQLSYIFGQSDDVLLNWLADVQIGIEFVGSQVSILALGIKDASIDLAEGLYAQLAAAPTLVASAFNGVNNSITNSVAGMTDPFARYITTAVFVPVYRSTEQLLAGSRDAIAQVPLIGDQVLHLAEVTGDGVVRVATLIWQTNYNISKGLDSSQDKVVQKVAASQQETTLSFVNLSQAGGDMIAGITGTFDNILLSSQGAVKEQIAQTNQQNLDFLAGAGLKLLETGNYLAQGVNKSLESSQDGVKDRIAQTHKGTSDRLAQTGEAIRITLRSIQKPAAETADFFYRFKVGVDTFQAIVFDEKPTMITDVTIEEIGTDYAVVSWKTNHFANGKVNYGSSLSYGEEIILEKREKYHQAKLTGLKPGQRIFFEVMSQNKNYAYDAYYSFETLSE